MYTYIFQFVSGAKLHHAVHVYSNTSPFKLRDSVNIIYNNKKPKCICIDIFDNPAVKLIWRLLLCDTL